MQDTNMMRRLALVRYLFDLGAEQSRKPEPLSSLSVLWFHDSIELFLATAADCRNIKKKSWDFMRYWQDFREAGLDLPEEVTMSRLSKGRADLKHHGLLPSSLQIESYRGMVTAFFEAATPLIFGLEFESVSLIDMIGHEDARFSLQEADRLAAEGDLDYALGKLALAFRQQVDAYEDRRSQELGAAYRTLDFDRISTDDIVGWEGAKWTDFLETLFGSLQALDLGLDHARYVKFQMLTPLVDRRYTPNAGWFYTLCPPSTRRVHREATMEDFEYCRGFAIEASLKIERVLSGGG